MPVYSYFDVIRLLFYPVHNRIHQNLFHKYKNCTGNFVSYFGKIQMVKAIHLLLIRKVIFKLNKTSIAALFSQISTKSLHQILATWAFSNENLKPTRCIPKHRKNMLIQDHISLSYANKAIKYTMELNHISFPVLTTFQNFSIFTQTREILHYLLSFIFTIGKLLIQDWNINW